MTGFTMQLLSAGIAALLIFILASLYFAVSCSFPEQADTIKDGDYGAAFKVSGQGDKVREVIFEASQPQHEKPDALRQKVSEEARTTMETDCKKRREPL